MSKIAKYIPPLFIILASVSAIVYFIADKGDIKEISEKPSYPVSKHFKWRYSITNTSDKTLENLRFKALIPVKITANQRLGNIESSKKYSATEDRVGNTYANFQVNEIAPHAKVIIDIKAQLDFAISSQSFFDIEPTEYLSPSFGIESDNEELIGLANKLKKKNPKDSLKSYYDWIISHLDYSGYIKEDLGALYAYKNKRGDCTEYAYLMAALARASNIPARVIGGYVYSEDSLVKAEDYHNWVEVFYDKRWHIIDPQKQRFMDRTEEYLTVRIFPPEVMELKNSHQVIVSDERVKVNL